MVITDHFPAFDMRQENDDNAKKHILPLSFSAGNMRPLQTIKTKKIDSEMGYFILSIAVVALGCEFITDFPLWGGRHTHRI